MLGNQFHMTVEGFCFGQPLPTHHTKVSRFGIALALLGALGTGCKVAGEWGPLMSSLEATFPGGPTPPCGGSYDTEGPGLRSEDAGWAWPERPISLYG